MVKLVPVDDEVGSFSLSKMGGDHPAFDGSNIPGYDPATGEVSAQPAQSSAPRVTSSLMGAIEGLPLVGPYAKTGVENAAAGIASLGSGVPYKQAQEDIGQMVDSSVAAHPNYNTGGQVGGGVLGTLPMIVAAPTFFGAGPSASLIERILAGGLSGMALGGADAGVRGGTDAILPGAAMGLGLGAVAPGVGALIGKGVGALASKIGSGVSTADRSFARAAGSDAVSDMAPRLNAMGPDAMPMDLGPNLQRQAGAIAATPGRGQETVRTAIANRGAQAGERVSDAATSALGTPVDTMAVADDIIAKRSAASKPLYEAAYAKKMPFTPELKELLERPAMRKALKQAETLAANDEKAAPKQFFAKILDGGERPIGVLDASGREISAPNAAKVQFVRTPNVEELDLTKRALDDMIATAQRQGNNNEARIFVQLKNKLTGMVDKAAPEYAQAREAFSGPSSILDAIEEGRKTFSNSMTPGELRSKLSKMSPGEKEAFTQGARAQIADIMGTARNDAMAGRSAFDKGYNKEKLGLLIGRDNANKMLSALDTERAFAKTRDVVTGNSETAARAAAMQEIAPGSKQPGFIRSAMNLRFGDTAADLGDKVAGGVRSAAQEAKNAELAQLLTSTDPAMVTRKIQMVQAAQRRGDISAQKAKEIIQSFAIGPVRRSDPPRILGQALRQPLEITVRPNR